MKCVETISGNHLYCLAASAAFTSPRTLREPDLLLLAVACYLQNGFNFLDDVLQSDGGATIQIESEK